MNIHKALSMLSAAMLIVAMAACSGGKHLANGTTPVAQAGEEHNQQLLLKVAGTASKAKAINAKVNVKLSADGKKISTPGTLRMKRDQVVRLQLTAFGIMEAGRLEFTPDYVLLIDRINKRYAKARYADIDFLRDNGVTFASLQALFWGELFSPGKDRMTQAELSRFTVKSEAGEALVATRQGHLDYRWHVDQTSGRIKSADVGAAGVSLSCAYNGTTTVAGRPFAGAINLAFIMPARTFAMNIALDQVDTDDQWETLTTVSSRYKAVDADDILKLLVSLSN